MKLGQFVCLGNLQGLKNRFGSGYAVQVKLPLKDISAFKEELILTLPGVQIDGKMVVRDVLENAYCNLVEQHNGMLYCSVPFSRSDTPDDATDERFLSLPLIFEWFNKKKEENSIESFSITQTTLEQIFVNVAGEDQDMNSDENKKA